MRFSCYLEVYYDCLMNKSYYWKLSSIMIWRSQPFFNILRSEETACNVPHFMYSMFLDMCVPCVSANTCWRVSELATNCLEVRRPWLNDHIIECFIYAQIYFYIFSPQNISREKHYSSFNRNFLFKMYVCIFLRMYIYCANVRYQ